MQLDQNKVVFTFTLTGKCNSNCSYCHFYAAKDRRAYNRDMADELFDRYVDFVKFLQEKHVSVSCRFSGGEPLVMGDRLYHFTNKLFDCTGIKPYILTNGKLLNGDTLKKAMANHISSFIVSFENPIDMDREAVPTDENIDKYKKLQNKTVPLALGMVVVKNQWFKKIEKICDYFYDKINEIPPITEVNFTPYESPTDEELSDLYLSLKSVIKKYYGLSDLSFFPYITPEYCSANLVERNYLVPLPIDDKYDAMNKTNEELFDFIERHIDSLDFPYYCDNVDCEWHDACKRVSIHWKNGNKHVSAEQKLDDYCRFKKVISNAFFDALSELE